MLESLIKGLQNANRMLKKTRIVCGNVFNGNLSDIKRIYRNGVKGKVLSEILEKNSGKKIELMKKGKFTFRYHPRNYHIGDYVECEYAIALIENNTIYGLCFSKYMSPSEIKNCQIQGIPYEADTYFNSPIILNIENFTSSKSDYLEILNNPGIVRKMFNCDINKFNDYEKKIEEKLINRNQQIQEAVKHTEYLFRIHFQNC
ncbi:MAG: hypothetical protein WC916_01030 [Candidatus Woesearchaeota archaeon]